MNENTESKGSATKWVVRRAKLFEAGDYPEKGLVVTAENLKEIERNFTKPVPVLIEHSSSPLELGYLTQVSAEGNELFGALQLSPEANALIETSGAKSLSLGLSKDMRSIREVSLVQKPRIADAQIYSDDYVWFTADVPEVDWKEHFDQLSRRISAQHAEEMASQYVEQGKLLPSQVDFAVAMFKHNAVIEFDGDSVPLQKLLIAMLDNTPPHMLFQEQAPNAAADSANYLMLPQEAEFYRRYFPDVSLDQIAQRKTQ